MQNSPERLPEKAINPLGNDASIEKNKTKEANLIHIANEIYKEVINRYGEYFVGGAQEIYWQNACQQFSELMVKSLKENGIPSKFEYVVEKDMKKNNQTARQHIYVSTPDYYIDGTWQQFLKEPRLDNQVLVLGRENIVLSLEKAKVPKELWFMYGV